MLDVRPAEEYRAGHIPGALSIPLAELKARLQELPKDREVVAYCRGPYCVMAVEAVELLRRKGFTRASHGAGRRRLARSWLAHRDGRDRGTRAPRREADAVSAVRLGLRENLAQFSLLVVVNAFVGAMVGMERTILPPIAEQEFHLAAQDRGALVHRRVRRHEGAHELPRRTALGPLRAQARARRRLARRRAGAVPADVGADAGPGCSSPTRCSASARGSPGRRRSS